MNGRWCVVAFCVFFAVGKSLCISGIGSLSCCGLCDGWVVGAFFFSGKFGGAIGFCMLM